MSISVVGTPQGGGSPNGASVTLTFDVVPSVGDVIFAFCHHYGRSSQSALPTTPGYTTILDDYTLNNPHIAAAYKVVSGTPDTTVTLPGSASGNDANSAVCIILRGVHASVLGAAPVAQSGASTPPNGITITTAYANSWVLVYGGGTVLDTSPGTVAGYTNDVLGNGTDTNSSTSVLATKLVATPGAENPAAWSTFTNCNWKAFTIEVREAVGGPTTIPADLNSTGVGAANFLASSLFAALLNSAGQGSANFLASAFVTGVLNIAGDSDVVIAGAAINTTVLGIAAKATVSFDGFNAASTGTIVPADFDSDGFATVDMRGATIITSLLASVAKGAAAFDSGAVASSVLSSTGKGLVNFDGGVASVIRQSDFNSNGFGGTSLKAAAITAGALNATGDSDVNFNSGVTAKAVLNIAGTGSVFFNGNDASIVSSPGGSKIYVVNYRRRRRRGPAYT